MGIGDAIANFFGSNIAALAIIVVGIGILVWKVATAINKLNNKVDKVEELPCADHTKKLDKLASIETKVDDLPCHLHSEKIDRHHDQLGTTNELLRSLEGKMDMLVRLMPLASNSKSEQKFSDDVPVFSQKNSPKALNDNGKLVFEYFGCGEFLSTNLEWLLEEVEKFAPKTALDVETFSYSALLVASLDDRFNDLKNKIYKSPAIELKAGNGEKQKAEITLENVLFIISLPLRDAYLKKHPEILPE